MQQLEGKGINEMLRDYWQQLKEWLKPEPSDGAFLVVIKTIFKSIAMLVLLALSPLLLVILLFVFFAAL